MTLGDPPNPTSFTLFITVKSSKKFASVFWRAHYRVKKFLQWLPPTMGPSAPIKGFAFGPSSTHLEGAFRQSLAHKKKRPLTTWSSKSWLLKGQGEVLGEGPFWKGPDALDNKPWFLETPPPWVPCILVFDFWLDFFPNNFWMWRTWKSNNWSCNQSICRWINSPRFLTIIIPWQLWKFNTFFFQIFS